MLHSALMIDANYLRKSPIELKVPRAYKRSGLVSSEEMCISGSFVESNSLIFAQIFLSFKVCWALMPEAWPGKVFPPPYYFNRYVNNRHYIQYTQIYLWINLYLYFLRCLINYAKLSLPTIFLALGHIWRMLYDYCCNRA